MFFNQIFKGKNRFSDYLLPLLLILVVFFLSNGIAGIIIGLLANWSSNGNVSPEALQKLDFEALGINPLVGFTVLMGSFLPPFFFMFTMKKFFKRPNLSFITTRKKFDLKRTAFAALLWFIFMLLSTGIDYIIKPHDYSFTFQWPQFGILFILCVFLIPFQTSFEEIFIRGFFMQAAGAATKFRISAIILASLLFAFMHSMNPEIKAYGFWIMILNYFILGFMLALFTAMDGGLEIAIGVHFINNFFAATGVNYANSALKVPSLFLVQNPNPDESWIGMTVVAILMFYIFSRKYKWTNVKVLFTRIDKK